MIINPSSLRRRGFMLAEALVYIFAVVVVLAAIGYFVMQLYATYLAIVTPARVDRIGVGIMHELAKELRTGSSVDQSQTAFGVPAGFITINAVGPSGPVSKRLALESGRITYRENGGTPVYRTPADVSVSTFRLTPIVTPVSYAVRYEVSITYHVRGVEYQRDYAGLAVMRHSYE